MTAAFFFSAYVAQAANLKIEPAINTIEGIRREEFRFDLTITNSGPGMATVFPVPAEVDAETGEFRHHGGPSGDHQLSSSWLEFPRKELFLRSGQSKTLPIKFIINRHAEIGEYHHVIAFVPGTHPDVPVSVVAQSPKTMVNIKVKEDVVERLNLVSFGPVRRILTGFPVNLTATILNGGNRELIPDGRVRILDRHDREIESLTFNSKGVAVPEDTQTDIGTAWESRGFGRYKAVLEMRYGQASDHVAADSTFFWVIPLWLIGAAVGGALLLIIFLTHFIHRRALHHARQ